jgi:hypothetical protein
VATGPLARASQVHESFSIAATPRGLFPRREISNFAIRNLLALLRTIQRSHFFFIPTCEYTDTRCACVLDIPEWGIVSRRCRLFDSSGYRLQLRCFAVISNRCDYVFSVSHASTFQLFQNSIPLTSRGSHFVKARFSHYLTDKFRYRCSSPPLLCQDRRMGDVNYRLKGQSKVSRLKRSLKRSYLSR